MNQERFNLRQKVEELIRKPSSTCNSRLSESITNFLFHKYQERDGRDIAGEMLLNLSEGSNDTTLHHGRIYIRETRIEVHLTIDHKRRVVNLILYLDLAKKGLDPILIPDFETEVA